MKGAPPNCVYLYLVWSFFLLGHLSNTLKIPKQKKSSPFIVEAPSEVFDEQLNEVGQETIEVQNKTQLNERPIIGILSQETSKSMARFEDLQNYTSYIAASYVKFVEAAGARVVPVLINKDDAYYEELARHINGFIFPGGSNPITPESGYGRAGKKIYNLVMQAGKEGSPLPLWGTCLGFEMLLYLTTRINPLIKCKAINTADRLKFLPGFEGSRLFQDLPKKLIASLETKNITNNFHKYCVLPEIFNELGLNESMKILSTSNDTNGVEYVSTVEHHTLPIFGTQWHPEKAAYEWAQPWISHDLDAVRVSQALAEIFVNEARKNMNRFPSKDTEMKALIYNYQPIYVQPIYGSSFEQCYFFD